MKKDTQILIKVSKEEKAVFEQAAENKGLGLSAWARLVMRETAEREFNDNDGKATHLFRKIVQASVKSSVNKDDKDNS